MWSAEWTVFWEILTLTQYRNLTKYELLLEEGIKRSLKTSTKWFYRKYRRKYKVPKLNAACQILLLCHIQN